MALQEGDPFCSFPRSVSEIARNKVLRVRKNTAWGGFPLDHNLEGSYVEGTSDSWCYPVSLTTLMVIVRMICAWVRDPQNHEHSFNPESGWMPLFRIPWLSAPKKGTPKTRHPIRPYALFVAFSRPYWDWDIRRIGP